MKEFNILDPSLNILGPHLIEASAGTGKTFAIEHLFTRLLIESSLNIEQILVVTFTKAATKELKQRIRANLERGLEALRKQGPFGTLPYLEKAMSSPSAIRRLEDALIDFDKAKIFTIHGFCFRMLKSFAFEAHADMDLKDPEEENYQENAREIVLDFLRTKLTPVSYSPRQIHNVLKNHRNDPHFLSDRIIQLIQKKKAIEAFPTYQETYALFLKALNAASSAVKDFTPAFEKFSMHFKGLTSEKMQAQIRMFNALFEKAHCTEEEFEALLKEEEICLEKLEPTNLKAKAVMPHCALLETLQTTLLPPLLLARDSQKHFLRMAKDCALLFEKETQKKSLFSPDDLLVKMQACLSNSYFLAAVRKAFRAVIVDEFQDTDPIQWEIFEKLFLEKKSLLEAFYVVGDPKQSIYRFRGADVYTYLKAAEHLGKEGTFCLDTNYRSDPAFIQTLNAFFSKYVHSQWLLLPSLTRALEYREVKHKPEAENHPFQDGKGAFHFFMTELSSNKREKNWPPLYAEEESLFPFIANEVALLHEKEGLSLCKIAVLVKDRYQAERLATFLKKYNIASQVKKGENLLESCAFSSLKNLIDALLDIHSLSKLKIVLAGPFFGLDHQALKEGLENPHVQKAKILFCKLSDLFRKKGFSHFIQEFLQTLFAGKTIYEKITSFDRGSFYQDLRQLIELILEKEGKSQSALEDLSLYFEELKKRHFEDKTLLSKTPFSEEQIQIMTIHMSKGLEFDVVFALGLANRHTKLEDFIDIGDKIVELDPAHPPCHLYLQEQEAEKLRQLYVALTRAKKRVYIPLIFDAENKEIPIGSSSPIELFCKHLTAEYSLKGFKVFLTELKASLSIGYTEIREGMFSLTALRDPVEEVLLTPTPSSLANTPCFVHSFTSLSQKDFVGASFGGQESVLTNKTLFNLPTGKETGIILHAIFEKVFFYKLHYPYDRENVSSLIQKLVAKTHLEGWEDLLLTMVEQALHLPLNNAFSLVTIPPSQILQEMEFVYPYGKDLLKGAADLIFQKDGLYYLLDWKSNFLGSREADYGEDNLVKEMKEKEYFLQAEIYTAALKRYVKLFDNRPFKECFGGTFYLFLRGLKVYFFKDVGDVP